METEVSSRSDVVIRMETGDSSRSQPVSTMETGKSTLATLSGEIEMVHTQMFFLNDYCIYRVPKKLREINEAAYTPQVVSIGPFHYGKEEYKIIEAQKTVCLENFLHQAQLSLEQLSKFVEERETKLRKCYAEPIELNSEGFVKMILSDAVFVISVLITSSFESERKPLMIDYIRYDMCLIENQLPLFIIEELLQFSAILSPVENCSALQLVQKFLKHTWGAWVSEDIIERLTSSGYIVQHFVDFLRICQKPIKEKLLHNPTTLTTHGALELYRCGINFKAVKQSEPTWRLFDMKFAKDRVLEIPQLIITDSTVLLFGNIQVFELLHCDQADRYFTDYIYAMGKILCSSKDFDFLVDEGIIKNWRPEDDEVHTLFTNLRKGIHCTGNKFYFSDLFGDLNKYRRRHGGVMRYLGRITQLGQNPANVFVLIAVAALFPAILQAFIASTNN